jgi:hypothetical protein
VRPPGEHGRPRRPLRPCESGDRAGLREARSPRRPHHRRSPGFEPLGSARGQRPRASTNRAQRGSYANPGGRTSPEDLTPAARAVAGRARPTADTAEAVRIARRRHQPPGASRRFSRRPSPPNWPVIGAHGPRGRVAQFLNPGREYRALTGLSS